MKALDTNLLVRFLIADDLEQAEKVKEIFEAAENSETVFIISTVVVLELIWVLSAVYECTRSNILDALEQLCMVPILRFENPDLIYRLVNHGRMDNIDLPDLLIGLAGQTLGCDSTLTFDQKASRSELFTLA